jgi:methylenetetrahydrofolate reductase (NADPH)
MHYFKTKVDAGLDFAVTQMFFENESFYAFVDRCDE